MTLITNEIHMLDGFKKTRIVFAADRRLTYPDGSYAGSKQKLFAIPYLDGGVSYFGLANVYPKGKKQYLSDWLRNFINGHAATKSLRDFAFELRNELHSVIPPGVLENNASGFHICGYNTDGIPEFWFLRNIGGMDKFEYTNIQQRYMEPTADFWTAMLNRADGTERIQVRSKACPGYTAMETFDPMQLHLSAWIRC